MLSIGRARIQRKPLYLSADWCSYHKSNSATEYKAVSFNVLLYFLKNTEFFSCIIQKYFSIFAAFFSIDVTIVKLTYYGLYCFLTFCKLSNMRQTTYRVRVVFDSIRKDEYWSNNLSYSDALERFTFYVRAALELPLVHKIWCVNLFCGKRCIKLFSNHKF